MYFGEVIINKMQGNSISMIITLAGSSSPNSGEFLIGVWLADPDVLGLAQTKTDEQ
jgi:hypothetical protein